MANQEVKVVVAAQTFGSPLQISMIEYFKKLFKPEELSMRSVNIEPEKQSDALKQLFNQNKPTALIALDVRPDSDVIAMYKEANIPIVLFDEEAPGVSTIAIDNSMGGRIGGDYLISKGKKKIAIITGRTQIKGGYNAELRLKGFQQALKANGLSLPQGYAIEVIHYSREDGAEIMPKLITMGVDAIFCAAGDNCAQGLLSVAKEKGVKIPEDIAIVGFDDLPIARLSTPALTTIKQPLKEMAEAAYKMVMLHKDEILRNPQKAIFKPELVVRQSA